MWHTHYGLPPLWAKAFFTWLLISYTTHIVVITSAGWLLHPAAGSLLWFDFVIPSTLTLVQMPALQVLCTQTWETNAHLFHRCPSDWQKNKRCNRISPCSYFLWLLLFGNSCSDGFNVLMCLLNINVFILKVRTFHVKLLLYIPTVVGVLAIKITIIYHHVSSRRKPIDRHHQDTKVVIRLPNKNLITSHKLPNNY